MLRKLSLAGALTLALLTPARAGSALDLVFGYVQAIAGKAPSSSALKPRRAARANHGLDTRSKGSVVRASFYGGGERLNRFTASGEVFRPLALTCAHRSLPFGTRLRVAWRGRSVVVRVNDRGPALGTGRDVDLSRGAALILGMTQAGVATVTLERL
jgi:rare lipoprotein A